MSAKPSKKYRSPLDLPLNEGERVLIEASAGSGKTRAITTLIARLLVETPLRIENILVVTFTRAATAELRDRIRRLLQSIHISLDDGDGIPGESKQEQAEEIIASWKERLEDFDPERARKTIKRAIDDIDLAPVHTIHGFCQRTLSDFAFECDFPFDMEIIGQEDSMVQEAVRDFWRRRLRDIDPVQAAFIGDKKFFPAPLAKWVDRWRGKAIDIVPEEKDFSPETLQAAIDGWNSTTQEMRGAWEGCGDEYERELKEGGWLSKVSYNINTIDNRLAELKEKYLGEGLMLLPKKASKDKVELFAFLGLARLAAKSKKDESPPDEPAFTKMAQSFDAVNEACDALRDALEGWLRFLRRDLLNEIRRVIHEKIREVKKASYDDLLIELDGALNAKDGDRISQRLRERYEVALIDEYQDTDRIQARIFERIFGQASDKGDRPSLDPLFIVGDPKQSIYRFRGADVFAYLEAKEKARVKVSLDENWRSTPDLVEAINALFDRPCAFALPGDLIGYPKIKAGKKDRPMTIDAKANEAPFCLRLLPPAEDGKEKSKEAAGKEAAAGVVREIAALLGGENTTLQEKGKEARRLRGSDITVLVRKKHQGRLVAEEMRKNAIDCIEIGDDSVFATREAEQLERLLWALIEPAYESRVRGALAGDLFGLGTHELQRFEREEDRWNEWSDSLRSWKRIWEYDGVGVMLRTLIKQQQGAMTLLQSQNGPRRLTNLLHLADLLQDAQTRFRLTPSLLAKWLSDRLEDNDAGGDEIQLRLPSDDDLVRILTVHGSKGLEFPIVFYPFAWDGSDDTKKERAKKNEGAVCHLQDRPAGGKRYSEALDLDPDEDTLGCDRIEEFSEELRLLYVALTRAQYRCVVTWGKVKGAKNTPLAWLLHRGDGDACEIEAEDEQDDEADRGRPEEVARSGEPVITRSMREGVKKAAERFEALDLGRWREEVDDLQRRCPKGVAVTDIFEGDAAATEAPAKKTTENPDTLAEREFKRPIRPLRQITSYSALIKSRDTKAAADLESERPDHDALDSESPGEDEAPAMPTLSADSADTIDPVDIEIAELPKGAMTGRCLHRIFERLDLEDEAEIDVICRQETVNSGLDAKWQTAVRTMVERTRTALIQEPESDGFRLCDPVRRAVEMEFHFPLEDTRIDLLGRCLVDHGYPGTLKNALGGKKGFGEEKAGPIRGYMRGFIDLVVEHRERWYVLDYKSNRLHDYDKGSMEAEMQGHDYHLQYLIYLVALHRYLAFRLEGYDPDRHIGGAFYLFLRGIDPEKGTNEGIFHDRPATECLLALDACFEGGTPR